MRSHCTVLAAGRKRKLIAKMAWYPPADTVLRVPYTPGSDLANRVRGVVEEEARRLKVQVKVVEGGGVPLRRRVVTTDLARGQPCPQGNCPLCLTGDGRGGLHHHRAGVVVVGQGGLQAVRGEHGGGQILGGVRLLWILPYSRAY